jgi:glycine/sarcosine N-methyltransferase
MPQEPAHPPAAFYDDLAASYDRIYPDWQASSQRQGDALHAVIAGELGPGPHRVLDCAVGIGTQLLGLAANGHRLAGSDISPGAVGRAHAECRRRGVQAGLAVADMRALPFADGAVDVVVCADNSLPHLLTAEDVTGALGEMGRVARPGRSGRGDHARLRPGPPGAAVHHAAVSVAGDRRVDGHLPAVGLVARRRVAQRQTAYWALTRAQLSGFARQAGLAAPQWRVPDQTGFFQPLLLAHAPR